MKSPAPVRARDRVVTRADLARLLRALARRQDALSLRASKLEEDADALALDLTTLADDLAADVDTASPSVSPRAASSPGPGGDAARDALRRTAECGVAALAVAPRSDGSADVRIDGGGAFTLPPALADLLAVLAADRDHDDSGLVGWKSIDLIARLLEKRTGRATTRHAVTQQIHRLRRELFERGRANPWLVQTNRRYGARFAIRAGATAEARRTGADAAPTSSPDDHDDR